MGLKKSLLKSLHQDGLIKIGEVLKLIGKTGSKCEAANLYASALRIWYSALVAQSPV